MTDSGSDESDQEPSRTPLGPKFSHNRQNQRQDNHPKTKFKMAKTRMTNKNKSPPVKVKPAPAKTKVAKKTKQALPVNSKKATGNKKGKPQVVDLSGNNELEKVMKENKRLRALTASIAAGSDSKDEAQPGTTRAMISEVRRMTKQAIWPHVKIIKTPQQLTLVTQKVMERLNLQELNGLEGQDLDVAQKIWINTYKPIIRTILNDARNYSNQEVKNSVVKAYTDGTLAEFPDDTTVLDCALRKDLGGVDGEDKLEALQVGQPKGKTDAKFKEREAKCK